MSSFTICQIIVDEEVKGVMTAPRITENQDPMAPPRPPQIIGSAARILLYTPAILLETLKNTPFEVFDTDRQVVILEGCHITRIQQTFTSEDTVLLQGVDFDATTYHCPDKMVSVEAVTQLVEACDLAPSVKEHLVSQIRHLPTLMDKTV